MPRYVVLDGFMLGGNYGDVSAGDVVELSERDAAAHLFTKRIVMLQEEAVAPPPAAKRAPKHIEASKTDKEKN